MERREPSSAPTGDSGAKDTVEPLNMEDVDSLSVSALSLTFRDAGIEGRYLAEVAVWRCPVLMVIFCFDVFLWIFRASWQVSAAVVAATCAAAPACAAATWPGALFACFRRLASLCALHGLVYAMNCRSRRRGLPAARQEELVLIALITLAITTLISRLTPATREDYIYASFLIICGPSLLKIRWWIAMPAMAVPMATALAHSSAVIMPSAAKERVLVAWLAGGVMAWLVERYRRQTFAGQALAKAAHAKELEEKSAHLRAQADLAAAREEAAQRALVVTKEKAANEAKSEFMSLMCHEVRTPLNGCLASAEMLLETPLLDEQRELTNTIRISGSILLSTVSNFLDFFKVQAGKQLDIVRAPFHIMDLVSDVHCIVDAMMGPQRKVRLLPPQTDSQDLCLMGDPDRLKGVLLNLYSNAAKFTRAGFLAVRTRKITLAELQAGGFIDVRASYSACLAAMRSALEKGSSVRSSSDYTNTTGGGSGEGNALDEGWWLHSGGEASGAWQPPDWDAWQPCTSPEISVLAQGADARSGSADSTGRTAAPTQRRASFAANSMRDTDEPPARASDMSRPAAAPHGRQKVLVVEVVDTGSGVSEQARKRLFTQFCQGAEDEVGVPRACSGTGLGLSICARQMGVLGGTIGAMSNPGYGSIFWFAFPVEEAPTSRSGRLAAPCMWQEGHLTGVKSAREQRSMTQQNARQSVEEYVSNARPGPPPGLRRSSADSDGGHGCSPVHRSPSQSERLDALKAAAASIGAAEQTQRNGRPTHPVSNALSMQARSMGSHSVSANAVAASDSSLYRSAAPRGAAPPPCEAQAGLPVAAAPGMPVAWTMLPVPCAWPQGQAPPPASPGAAGATLGYAFTPPAAPGQHAQAPPQQQPPGQPAPVVCFFPFPPFAPTATYDTPAEAQAAHAQAWAAMASSPPTCVMAEQPRSPPGGYPTAGAADVPASGVHAAPGVFAAPGAAPRAVAPAHGCGRCASWPLERRGGVAHPDAPPPALTSAPPAVNPPVSSITPGTPSPDLPMPSVPSPRAPAAARCSDGGADPSPARAEPLVQQRRTIPAAVPRSHGECSDAGNSNRSRDSRRTVSALSLCDDEGPSESDLGITGLRVLLAEDNLINQLVAKKMLAALGAKVTVASNGREAVSAAAAEGGGRFDVVLMDMSMPVMDGVAAAAELRRRACQVPIVAMTANISERDQAVCRDAGMDGFLSKPILKGRLGRALKQVMTRGYLFTENEASVVRRAARLAVRHSQDAARRDAVAADGEGESAEAAGPLALAVA